MVTLSLAEQRILYDRPIGWGLYVHHEPHSYEPIKKQPVNTDIFDTESDFRCSSPSYQTYYHRPSLQEPLSWFGRS